MGINEPTIAEIAISDEQANNWTSGQYRFSPSVKYDKELKQYKLCIRQARNNHEIITERDRIQIEKNDN